MILICLFIAIPLSIMGIKKVELGEPFLALMRASTRDVEQYKVAIPSIPFIPVFENASGFQLILNAFIRFLNIFVWLLNAISSVTNVVIQFLQFIFFMIRNLINFKDTLANYAVPV